MWIEGFNHDRSHREVEHRTLNRGAAYGGGVHSFGFDPEISSNTPVSPANVEAHEPGRESDRFGTHRQALQVKWFLSRRSMEGYMPRTRAVQSGLTGPIGVSRPRYGED